MLIDFEPPPHLQLLYNQGAQLILSFFLKRKNLTKCPCLCASSVYLWLDPLLLSEPLAILLNYFCFFFGGLNHFSQIIEMV